MLESQFISLYFSGYISGYIYAYTPKAEFLWTLPCLPQTLNFNKNGKYCKKFTMFLNLSLQEWNSSIGKCNGIDSKSFHII